MQMIWGVALDTLSDSEAGRFIKTVYAFMRGGDASIGNGKEAVLIAQALETLRQDKAEFDAKKASNDAKAKEKTEKRRKAAMERWSKSMQNNANAEPCMQVHASASNSMQVHDFASQNKNKNIETEKETESESKSVVLRGGKPRFTPPTLDEVLAYCDERQNNVDAERFIDFYEAKGWKVGNQPMKDWRAAVRTWERNDTRQGSRPAQAPKKSSNPFFDMLKAKKAAVEVVGEEVPF